MLDELAKALDCAGMRWTPRVATPLEPMRSVIRWTFEAGNRCQSEARGAFSKCAFRGGGWSIGCSVPLAIAFDHPLSTLWLDAKQGSPS